MGYFLKYDASYNDLIRLLYVNVSNNQLYLEEQLSHISIYEDFLIWDQDYSLADGAFDFWSYLEESSYQKLREWLDADVQIATQLFESAAIEPGSTQHLRRYNLCEHFFAMHHRLLDYTIMTEKITDTTLRSYFYSYLAPILSYFRKHEQKLKLFYAFSDELVDLFQRHPVTEHDNIPPLHEAIITVYNYENNIRFLLGEDMEDIKAHLYETIFEFV